MELEAVIQILEVSVRKNGEIELTNKHLLNILKIATRYLEIEDDHETWTQEFWKD